MYTEFESALVDFEYLRHNAYNFRWAVVPENVIPLTAADLDFPVARPITDAIVKYSERGYFNYGPATGLPIFKDAVAEWYNTTKNTLLEGDHVYPANSAAMALYIAVSTCIKEGDEVVIPNPVDFLFRKSVGFCGGKITTVDQDFRTGCLNLNQLESAAKKAKLIMLCNPNNPIGKCIPEANLEQINQIALKYGCIIIADEIWADIDFQHKFKSILSLPGENNKIVVSGLSKNFGLAGLRLGYLICKDEMLLKKIAEKSMHGTTIGGLSTLSQVAGTAALTEGKQWLESFLNHLKGNKSLIENRLKNLPIFESYDNNATFIYMLKLNGNLSVNKVCEWSLKQAEVAIVPGGKDWFESNSEGHIRISYATSRDILTEALDRLEKALPLLV